MNEEKQIVISKKENPARPEKLPDLPGVSALSDLPGASALSDLPGASALSDLPGASAQNHQLYQAKRMVAAVPFERTRRITGYLVGTLDRFNNAKRCEERERVKHGYCSGC